MKQVSEDNKSKINALMRILKARNFQHVEKRLNVSFGTVSRIFHGEHRFSHRLFLRAAIELDMHPSELMEKLGIEREYFWGAGR